MPTKNSQIIQKVLDDDNRIVILWTIIECEISTASHSHSVRKTERRFRFSSMFKFEIEDVRYSVWDEHNFYRIFSIVYFLWGYFQFNENKFDIAVRTFLVILLIQNWVYLQKSLNFKSIYRWKICFPLSYSSSHLVGPNGRGSVFVWYQNNPKAKKFKSNGVCSNFNYS